MTKKSRKSKENAGLSDIDEGPRNFQINEEENQQPVDDFQNSQEEDEGSQSMKENDNNLVAELELNETNDNSNEKKRKT